MIRVQRITRIILGAICEGRDYGVRANLRVLKEEEAHKNKSDDDESIKINALTTRERIDGTGILQLFFFFVVFSLFLPS